MEGWIGWLNMNEWIVRMNDEWMVSIIEGWTNEWIGWIGWLNDEWMNGKMDMMVEW